MGVPNSLDNVSSKNSLCTIHVNVFHFAPDGNGHCSVTNELRHSIRFGLIPLIGPGALFNISGNFCFRDCIMFDNLLTNLAGKKLSQSNLIFSSHNTPNMTGDFPQHPRDVHHIHADSVLDRGETHSKQSCIYALLYTKVSGTTGMTIG